MVYKILAIICLLMMGGESDSIIKMLLWAIGWFALAVVFMALGAINEHDD